MGLEAGTIAIISAATALAGSGVAAYSSYQQGKAQERLSDYNAALAQQEAATAERDAKVLANRQREENDRLMARQRALFAKSGVVGTTGTPLLVQADQAVQGEMAAMDVERTGNIEAGRYRQQAVLDRMQGKSARRAGLLGAGSSLLGGISQAAGVGASYRLNSSGK
ncbi:hypothetical protein OpiT1DRAFT_03833 [Opitutaceae bacterium TAV1]|nr:hypothetical protein OpiT1DRAFT_03833 [Opitutaceae bacterium TAV1]